MGGGPAAGEFRRASTASMMEWRDLGSPMQSMGRALRLDAIAEEMEPMNAALLDVGRLETSSRSAKQDCAGWGFLAVSSN